MNNGDYGTPGYQNNFSCQSSGDSNLDDTINIVDIVFTVGYILGNQEFNNDNFCEADMDINGTLASPAIALTKRVFPQPGGPTRRKPFGIFAPNFEKLSGSRKKDTISLTSSTASGNPAKSSNRVSIVCES